MGILRVYLALCVVTAHSTHIFPWSVHDAKQAVQLFFIISGFYMELVLSEKYSCRSEFYLGRFMRIFMPYWIILALVIASGCLMGWTSGHWGTLQPYLDNPLGRNGILGFALASLTNLTLFFQDLVLFVQHDAGQPFAFTSDFLTSSSPLWHYSLIPPAWSIGVELIFYAIVPFLHKLRTRTLIIVLSGSILLRILAYECLGLRHDPWDYRFLPFEIACFVLGMIGCRMRPLWSQLSKFQPHGKVQMLGWSLSLILFFALAQKGVSLAARFVDYHYAVLPSYCLWGLIIIPALFGVFRGSRHDRSIGDLSYPIYLIHYPLIATIRPFLDSLGVPPALFGWIYITLTVAVSALLTSLVLNKLEERRSKTVRVMAGLLGVEPRLMAKSGT